MLRGLFRDGPWVGLPTEDVVGLLPSQSVSICNFSDLPKESVSTERERLGLRPMRLLGLGVAVLLLALRLNNTEVLLPTPDGEFVVEEALSP